MAAQDSGDAPQVISSLPPRMQANFLFAFSFAYTGTYSLAVYLFDRDRLPELAYFATLGIAYLLFWLPFHMAYFRIIPRAVVRILNNVAELLTRTSVAPQAIPPRDQGSLLAPREARRPADSRWPLWQSVLVQLLAASVIVMTAWCCTYSGGPFQSPYGQILLALPLLSPTIAAKSTSIVGVYLASAASALVFQYGFTPAQSPPAMPWYVWTTLGVLAISAYISWLTRRAQERSVKAMVTS